jgi:hypothetical protein
VSYYFMSPLHWTYEEINSDLDLYQGDILEPTEELRFILKEVHPHFLDPKYSAFLLITQTCDMVYRSGDINTDYLSIAVIRPLESVIHDFLSHVCRPVTKKVYLKETKNKAYDLMERLLNQNEHALGLFYLHQDSSSGINTPSVALLRISVTLRVEHYEVLKNARKGRLKAEFRNKLGWLVGNLYARIGTEDWHKDERIKEMGKLIEQYISGKDDFSPTWIPSSWVENAKKNGVNFEQLPGNDISETLSKYKPPTAKEQIVEQVKRVLCEIVSDMDKGTLTKIGNRLFNDALFSKAIRSAKSETEIE